MPANFEANVSQLEVKAHYASFDRLAAFAEANAADWPRSDVLRLILVLEELFTNSVGHGYGGECEMPVRLLIVRDGDKLLARYEDEAPPFDPYPVSATASMPATAGSVPDRVGGLGLWLVRHYVRDYRHSREHGSNRTAFMMRPADRPAA